MNNKILIHKKAMACADQYKKSEAVLLEILQEVDRSRLYLEHDCTSLFQYVVNILKLSESIASNFITVARKSVEVPELKVAVQSGQLTVSKARKITSVLTPENQNTWIEKAISLPQNKLEFEVAKSHPLLAIPERIKPVCADRIKVELGVSDKLYKKIKRVQDLEAQRTKQNVNLEQTLECLVEEYLERNDPLVKAQRAELRVVRQKQSRQKENSQKILIEKPTSTSTDSGRYLPADIKYKVTLRDQGQCAYNRKGGNRCDNKRWLEIHHIQPLYLGGTNSFENLKTLCSTHHKLQH